MFKIVEMSRLNLLQSSIFEVITFAHSFPMSIEEKSTV